MAGIGSREEYANGPVPEPVAVVAGWRIALVKIGVIIALPAFVMGAEIGSAQGLGRSALVFAAGAAILTVLGMATGSMAASTRLSTAQIIRLAFGRDGGRLVSGVLSLTLLGWFGVTAQIFGESLAGIGRQMGIDLGPTPYILIGGSLMITTTLFGFAGLQRLSNLVMPLVVLVLLTMAFLGWRMGGASLLLAVPADPPGLGIGISAVVGAMVVGATIFPDITRFARTGGQARIAALLSYGMMPLVLILAAIPGIATGHRDLVALMVALGLGVPALLFLVVKAWMTNAGNLYSSSLGLSAALGRVRHHWVVGAAGAIGVSLAAMGVSSHLIPLMLAVGIAIPPVAAIYLTDYFVISGRRYDPAMMEVRSRVSVPAFLSWGVAIAVGAGASTGWYRLTGIPAIDAMLAAGLCHFLLSNAQLALGQSHQTSE